MADLGRLDKGTAEEEAWSARSGPFAAIPAGTAADHLKPGKAFLLGGNDLRIVRRFTCICTLCLCDGVLHCFDLAPVAAFAGEAERWRAEEGAWPSRCVRRLCI